jgi:hypothetical protein
MSNSSDLISELSAKIEALIKKQEGFQKEVLELKDQLLLIQNNENELASPTVSITDTLAGSEKTEIPQNILEIFDSYQQKKQQGKSKSAIENKTTPQKSLDLEKFIGENLINKIGIAVTIIGVAIGVNYSIEHGLISPLLRIVLGYLVGAGLLGFGYMLRSKYKAFSAVLSSGAIAIFYFISFAAYDFYHLYPQAVAFILMLLFTVYAVYTAIQYDFEIVAHIGMVGAYAVPFLLGDKSGSAFVLLFYTTIINIGILILAFKKYWKNLNYASFIVSWLIFATWNFGKYDPQTDFQIAFVFAIVFFLIFYLMMISYKLLRNEIYVATDIVLLIANSFIFYKISYSLLDGQSNYSSFLGLFTILNALIHYLVAIFVYKRSESDQNLHYTLIGLSLTFVTIAIPVQFHGHWVTISWICESAFLFWIGRTQQTEFYEKISYPVLILSFFSLLGFWDLGYFDPNTNDTVLQFSPIFNEFFLTSIIYIGVIGFMNFIQFNYKTNSSKFLPRTLDNWLTYVLPILLMFTIYFSGSLEISNYWNHLHLKVDVGKNILGKEYDHSVLAREFDIFRGIWLSIYTMIYFSLLGLINIKIVRNRYLGWVNMTLAVWVLFFFITVVCYNLNALQDTHIHPTGSLPFHQHGFSALIRYISYGAGFSLLFSLKNYVVEKFILPTRLRLGILFDISLNVFIFSVGSFLVVHLFFVFTDDSILGIHCLSILWSIYALVLIIMGISKQLKHLRVIAIIMFSITLVKLFLYDTDGLGTIGKTVVFVTVGILLLIVSYLYNRYKSILLGKSNVE